MTLREKVADWLTGGEYRQQKINRMAREALDKH